MHASGFIVQRQFVNNQLIGPYPLAIPEDENDSIIIDDEYNGSMLDDPMEIDG
jgi:hypothetical protein